MERLSRDSGIVHPDVEDRMKKLGSKLCGMALRKYKNSMIIKCNKTLSIVAVGFGTAYSVRTGELFRTAIDAGAKTTHQ